MPLLSRSSLESSLALIVRGPTRPVSGLLSLHTPVCSAFESNSRSFQQNRSAGWRFPFRISKIPHERMRPLWCRPGNHSKPLLPARDPDSFGSPQAVGSTYLFAKLRSLEDMHPDRLLHGVEAVELRLAAGLSSSRLGTSHFRGIRQARFSAQSLVARVIGSTEGLSGLASRARGCIGSVGETSVHKDL